MSIKINIYNQKGESVDEIKLSDQIFGVKTNQALVHQAMVAQMANERQVLAHTKDRGEVRGGGKKPWRQKGTGRARAGSNRSPIWIGGGITFGPTKERNFKKKINKKMKQKAIFMVLSDRIANNNLIVIDKIELNEYKTKIFNSILENLESKVINSRSQKAEIEKPDKSIEKKELKVISSKKEKRSFLIINDKKDEKIKYSGRNLKGVEIINLENINILDLLKYKNIVLTVEGIKKFEEKYQ